MRGGESIADVGEINSKCFPTALVPSARPKFSLSRRGSVWTAFIARVLRTLVRGVSVDVRISSVQAQEAKGQVRLLEGIENTVGHPVGTLLDTRAPSEADAHRRWKSPLGRRS
jgi:hypothetical protein